MKTIWKTEGPSDLLSLISLGLPEDHSACCNVFGASETPNQLSRFRGARVFVIHDCDQPGQSGAIEVKNGAKIRPGWAVAIAKSGAAEVRNVILPYPITENHGKDLRDWINEQLADGLSRSQVYERLIALAESMEPIPVSEAAAEELPGDGSATSEEVIEAIDDPHRLARLNLEAYRGQFGRDLKYWNETWYAWKDGRYTEITRDHLESRINQSIKREFDRAWADDMERYEKWRKSADYSADRDKGPPTARKVTLPLTRNVMEATKSLCFLSANQRMHAWIKGDHLEGTFVCVQNGILNLSRLLTDEAATIDDVLLPHSSNWFSTAILPYKFDPEADCPRWKRFLYDVFNNDEESIDAIQQWFGYLLTPDNFLQKIMFVIGQPRSGKGTMIRVMRWVLGENNIATPTLSELGQQYGLTGLLGKTVGIIADARMSDRIDETVVTERLLSISGADPQNIQRKYKSTLVGYDMCVRFTLFSNLLPRLKDTSAAFISRCIFLSMPNSYLGKEDETLQSQLEKELPGILNWAIMGRYMLSRNKKIRQPESGRALLSELKSIISPVLQFIEDCCELADGVESSTREVFKAWELWCEENDISHPGNIQSFSRKLKAIKPTIDTVQRREGLTSRRMRHFLGVKLKS